MSPRPKSKYSPGITISLVERVLRNHPSLDVMNHKLGNWYSCITLNKHPKLYLIYHRKPDWGGDEHTLSIPASTSLNANEVRYIGYSLWALKHLQMTYHIAWKDAFSFVMKMEILWLQHNVQNTYLILPVFLSFKAIDVTGSSPLC